MPTWLEKLKATEISLVDRGANNGAVSVLMKRAGDGLKDLAVKLSKAFGKTPEEVEKILSGGDGMPMTLDDVTKKLEETTSALTKLQGRADLSDSIGKISIAINKAKSKKEVKEQDEEVEKLDKTDPRVGVLKGMITELLTKAAHHDEYSANLDGDEKTKFEAMPMKEKDAYMEKNPVKGGEDEGEEDEEGGDGNAEVEKKLKAVMKKLDDANSKVEKMEQATEIRKIMDTELKDMKDVSKREPLAEAIYKIRKANPEQADVIVATLKSQAAYIKTNDQLLKEIGKGGDAAPDAGSAEGKLEQMSGELAKKLNVSIAKAQSIVLDTPEGKELYKQIEMEKRARGTQA